MSTPRRGNPATKDEPGQRGGSQSGSRRPMQAPKSSGKALMKTSIEIKDGVLVIDALDVTDDVTVSYINALESDARVAAVLNCMQLGARALAFTSDKTGESLLAET